MNRLQFAQTIKQKYPQYANIPDDQLATKVLQKYPQYQSKVEGGEGSWLTGNRTSLAGKAFEGVGNILNLPSYAVGGVLDEVQNGGLNPIKGAIGGVRGKKAVMRELPETFGVDPNSFGGMALGFAGELATPGLPIGKIGKLFGAGKNLDLVGDGLTAAGKGLENAGEGLTLRALKPSPSQQRKFLEQTGQKMSSFLSDNPSLIGNGERASEGVSKIIDDLQSQYNALARSGKQIDPNDFVQALMGKADEIEKADFSIEAKRVADRIREQASYFAERSAKEGGRIPIDVLTDTKSSAYGKAGGAIYDPVSLNAQREIGNVGVDTISKYAPETRPLGQTLRNYRLFQDIAEQQSGLGKGSNLISAFAPSGLMGAAGFSQGDTFQDKARNGTIGFLLGKTLTNPKTLSGASKAFQSGGKAIQNPLVGKSINNLLGTGLRVASQPKTLQTMPTTEQKLVPQGRSELQTLTTKMPGMPLSSGDTKQNPYSSILPPKFKPKALEYKAPSLNIFKNKSSFGKRFKLGEQGGGNPFSTIKTKVQDWQAQNRANVAKVEVPDVANSAVQGAITGAAGFTGLDKKIPIGSQYTPKTNAGKVASVIGSAAGYAAGAGKYVGPFEKYVQGAINVPKVAKTAPIVSKAVNTVARKVIPPVATQLISALPGSVLQSASGDGKFLPNYSSAVAGGLAGRAVGKAVGAVADKVSPYFSKSNVFKAEQPTGIQGVLQKGVELERNFVTQATGGTVQPRKLGKYAEKLKLQTAAGGDPTTLFNKEIPLLLVQIPGKVGALKMSPSQILSNSNFMKYVVGPANESAKALFR